MLRINQKKLMDAIKKDLNSKMTKLAKYAVKQMKVKISELPDSGSHDATGASDWRDKVARALTYVAINESSDSIVKEFGLVGANRLTLNRALLINYGMGNTLDRNNPYLSGYLGSEYYDNSRVGYNVYQRDGEEVYDYEKGIWYISTAGGHEEITRFWQTPSHFFESVMIEVRKEFQNIINSAFDNINLVDFIENV